MLLIQFCADTQSVKFDANLPNDLKKLLQALFCELCNVKLNSPITAKIHYESKVHEKKVRHWLDEWSKRTGNPIPEIQSVCLNDIEFRVLRG